MFHAEGSILSATTGRRRPGSRLRFARRDVWNSRCARSSSSRAVWRGSFAEGPRRRVAELGPDETVERGRRTRCRRGRQLRGRCSAAKAVSRTGIQLVARRKMGCDSNPPPQRTVPLLFYSGDRSEPPHVHVERDDDEPKFWLRPVALAANWRFLGNGAPQGESYSCREPDCSTRELE